MTQRPTGIIRTLPWFGAEDAKHLAFGEKGKAYWRMRRAFRRIDKSGEGSVLISLSQKPTIEVLHCYVLIAGLVRVRANIADFLNGQELGDVRCWDDSTRQAKWWAVLTSPISWPPEEVRMRGFQGFRYTENLW
jgi:hypothetical protein